MSTERDQFGVVMDSNGYVVGYACSLNHGGNARYSGPVSMHYQCVGCGNFETADTIRVAQHVAGVREAKP